MARSTGQPGLPCCEHAARPIWYGGHHDEALLLEHCYRNALQLLRGQRLRTIAFPAISCGVYGYPAAQAAEVAVTTLRDEPVDDDGIDVTLCCFSDGMRAIFQHALNAA